MSIFFLSGSCVPGRDCQDTTTLQPRKGTIIKICNANKLDFCPAICQYSTTTLQPPRSIVSHAGFKPGTAVWCIGIKNHTVHSYENLFTKCIES